MIRDGHAERSDDGIRAAAGKLDHHITCVRHEEQVITFAASQRIGTCAAIQRIGARIADQTVSAQTTEHGFNGDQAVNAMPPAAAAGAKINRDRAGGVGIARPIIICAAIQRVIACTAIQRVIARAAIQTVTAGPALQAIGIVAARKVLILAPARDQRVISAITREDLISTIPAIQAIGIVAAREGLPTAPARDQRVIPGIAIESLTNAVPTLQAIGKITTADVLNPRQPVMAIRAGSVERAEIDRNRAGCVGVDRPIIPITAIQRVMARATQQGVIASAGIQPIGKAITQNAVSKITAEDMFNPRQTVIALGAGAVERAKIDRDRTGGVPVARPITPITANQRVMARAALQHIGQAITQDAVFEITSKDIFNLRQAVIASRAG